MRKAFLLILLSSAFFLSALTNKAYAGDCEKVNYIEVTPASASGNTRTLFTFSGQIENCSNKTSSYLQLYSKNPQDGKFSFRYGLTTDADGKFDLPNAVFPNDGKWIIQVSYQQSYAKMDKPLQVQIMQAVPPQCGDIVPDNTNNCPVNCRLTKGEDNLWRCGELSSDISSRCKTSILPSQMIRCESPNLNYVLRCGTNNSGYVCPTTEGKLCLNGDEAIPENVVCETPPAPTPSTPFPPPCSKGIDKNGNEVVVKDPADQEKIVKCTSVSTGLGISISTDPTGFIKSLFGILLSLSGGIALILIIVSGYQLMTSQGNPEKVQAAKETLTSAIVGLLFIIFSMVILQIIGVTILEMPWFK